MVKEQITNASFPVTGPWSHHHQLLHEDAAIVAYLDHRMRHDVVGPESPN